MEKKKLKLLKQQQRQRERERLEQERLEQERLEQERLEQQRLEQERLDQERLEKELLKEEQRLEQERLEKQRAKRERILRLFEQRELERQKEAQRLERQHERERKKEAQLLDVTVTVPKTPSPIHTNFQTSPDAADKEALRDASSAPKPVQVSEHRTNTKFMATKKEKFDIPHSLVTEPPAAAALTSVSPNSTMETPKHRNTSAQVLEDTPESTEGLPKISKFLQPKRIDMQEKPKKRSKEQQSKEPKAEKAASVAASSEREVPPAKKARKAEPLGRAVKTLNATKPLTDKSIAAATKKPKPPSGMFETKSIGSLPFNSPAPKINKHTKMNAPMKPKKLTGFTDAASVSVSPSTGMADAPAMVSTAKAQSAVLVVSTPSSKLSSATGERKRNRPPVETGVPAVITKKIARSTDEMSTAMLLAELASPKPAKTAKPNQANKITSVTPKPAEPTGKPKPSTIVTPSVATVETNNPRLPVKSGTKVKVLEDRNRPKNVIPPTATKKNSNISTKPKGKSSTSSSKPPIPQSPQPTREELLHEKISEQYRQLRAYLDSFTERSMAFIHSRNLRGPVPSALAGGAKSDKSHAGAYAKLLVEHRAAHDYLQRRLLRSAETTLRLLLESRISSEEARTELKQAIKKFEEILCDTLHRQETQRLAVVAQYYGNPSNFSRKRGLQDDEGNRPSESTEEDPDYPCKKAFDKVEEICLAITRPPGRPRSALAALR